MLKGVGNFQSVGGQKTVIGTTAGDLTTPALVVDRAANALGLIMSNGGKAVVQ